MEESRPILDLIITNARIVDGSGFPAYEGAVGVRDGKIAAFGEINEQACETLDAGGRVVCPGFIDVHTHYDAQVFWDGTLSPSCYHGVTTIFGGFCGFSIAPMSKEAAPYLMHMLARVEGMPVASLAEGVPWDWQSFGEFLGRLDGRLGVNAGFMAGHSTIRRVVMGERAVGHEARAHELRAMTDLLGRCLREGAMGFSSSLAATHNDANGDPVPSRHAGREEIVALAQTCRDYPGTFLEFLPGVEMNDQAKQLMLDLSIAARRPLNWNVLVASSDQQAIDNQLSATDFARANGGEVLALTVPQPVSARINLYSGFTFDAFPGWESLFKMPLAQRIEALKDPERRIELDKGARSAPYPLKVLTSIENYTVDAVFNEQNKRFEGRIVGEIAAEQNKAPIDVLFDLAISEELRTSFRTPIFGAEESIWQVRARLWEDDRTLIGGSDAGAHLDMIDTFAFSTQVLGNGVREHKVISLEKAVHKMTEVAAAAYGLTGRGLLKVGYNADIVVFDPDKVGCGPVYPRMDLPGNELRLYADSVGIDHVFVNGVQTIRNGAHTGLLPGKALRSGRDTYTSALRPEDRPT